MKKVLKQHEDTENFCISKIPIMTADTHILYRQKILRALIFEVK